MRSPEAKARFEEEQTRTKAYEAQVVELLVPIFAKFDPESLIGLTPDGFHEDACRTHYDCVMQDVARTIHREKQGLSVDNLAHMISLASHIHYEMWGSPVRTFSVHFRMAEEILPLLFSLDPNANPTG